MNNKLINVCCLPDTSAISCILSSQDNKLNIHEEERINSLRILKEEINDFVISALVIHELVLGLEEKYLKDDAFIIIMNYIKSYFNSLKIKSSSSEKNIKDDEIDLINCAISLLNIKTDNNKYEFIKLLLRDFDNFYRTNKKITEDNKILLVKRRMELYKDNSDKKQDYKYYRKKLTSLSE